MQIILDFGIEERRRAHIVAMYARKHIRLDGILSQFPYIDKSTCLHPEVNKTKLVILLSLEGVWTCRQVQYL